MPIYQKASLESLKQRVDLVEVLSAHMELKRAGAVFKGLCPFHDEKTPSFTIQRGDSPYHCFGCGAHGDAIQFLMSHQKLSFGEAVESLAQRFNIVLEVVDQVEGPKGPSKASLKEALDYAARFYHFYLLHTQEGQDALKYLYDRAIDLDFIIQFQIGLSPKRSGIFHKIMQKKGLRDDVMIEAGLLSSSRNGKDFFSDRIMFPIHSYTGEVIGFSGRKYKEDTFGGKYVNTPETPLFKKSRVLFGANHSRRRIAKERKAIIVEGQIDTLRLIQSGFNYTVSGQGTAFGESHVKDIIQLGVNLVFLALDADNAGEEATVKIGHLFQKEGVEARVVSLPAGSDPDSFITENGPDAFEKLLDGSEDYLSFLVKHLSRECNCDTPAGKNELLQQAIKLIRAWDHPVMVHETLKKLASLMRVPEEYVGVGQESIPSVYVKRSASIGSERIDPSRILETDLLRWLLLYGQEMPRLVELVKMNLDPQELEVLVCRKILAAYLSSFAEGKSCDVLSLVITLDDAEAQLLMSDLVQKKVNKERAEDQLAETMQKIKDRNWMQRREHLKNKLHQGQLSHEEEMNLVKQFDELRRTPPLLVMEVPHE